MRTLASEDAAGRSPLLRASGDAGPGRQGPASPQRRGSGLVVLHTVGRREKEREREKESESESERERERERERGRKGEGEREREIFIGPPV